MNDKELEKTIEKLNQVLDELGRNKNEYATHGGTNRKPKEMYKRL